MTALVQKFRLSDLEAWAQNPRRISAEALEGLKESITTFGAIDMPVVNVHDGKKRLVSGHQRVRALMESGVQHADCLAVDLDDAMEMAANLTLNNPHIQGTFDVAKASPMIDSLSNDFKRAGFAALQTELTRQVARMEAPKPKAQNAVSEKVTDGRKTAKSTPGTVYSLGKHRLYCGPFQEAAPKFFGAKGARKADACITDPPYNVVYSGAAGEVFNDSMNDNDWMEFMVATCKAILDNTNGPCYAFMSTKELDTLHKAFKSQGAIGLRTLWWIKDRPTIYLMRAASLACYSWQHEPLVRCQRAGLGEFPLKQPRTSVFQCARSHRNQFHPCLPPNEEVLTSEGWKKISRVTVGEQVLSADGEYHKVTYVSSHAGPDFVFVIRTSDGMETKATGNHPFLILRGSSICWVYSELLEVGDLVLSPACMLATCRTMKPCHLSTPPKKDTAEGILTEPPLTKGDNAWNMLSFGSSIMALFLKGIKSIIGTGKNRIIACPISNLSAPLTTSGFTVVANCETEFGGNHAGSVKNSNYATETTGTTENTAGCLEKCAKNATSDKLSKLKRFVGKRVESVKTAPNRSPVHNLEVDGIPAFQTRIGMSHNTSKPLDLVRDIMEGCTDPGDLVWDPFVGGGTTLLVAEELNRICFASELDPWYCDQVRTRYVLQAHGEAADWQALSPAVAP